MNQVQEVDIFSSPAAQKLKNLLADWRSSEGQRDFREFEERLNDALAGLGCVAIAIALSDLDVDAELIEVAGVIYKKSSRSRETYIGTSGEVSVERNLYCPQDGKGDSVCPLELRAGIVEGTWTPKAAEVMAMASSLMTPYEAEKLLREVPGFSPSRASLDRLPKALSERWEEHRSAWEQAVRMQEEIPAAATTVTVSLDGVMVPMKDGERTEKRAQAEAAGKKSSGPNGYREAGCGTVSFYDQQGDRLGSIYYGRMPESKKVILHEQLRDELLSLGDLLCGLNLNFLADGALENWRILGEIRAALLAAGIKPASLTEIVDFYHATDHLKTATDLRFGEGSSASSETYELLRLILRDEDDGIDLVLGELKTYVDSSEGKRKEGLATELGYFEKNRDRMRFAEYQRLGFPIGSGVTEAACKTLVTQRLKRSGMSWGVPGGQGILTLRALLQSERWKSGWKLLSHSYKLEIGFRTGSRREELRNVA